MARIHEPNKATTTSIEERVVLEKLDVTAEILPKELGNCVGEEPGFERIPGKLSGVQGPGGAFATSPTTTVMLSSPPRLFASSISVAGSLRYQVIAMIRSSSPCST